MGKFDYIYHKEDKPKRFVLQSHDLDMKDDGECVNLVPEIPLSEYSEGYSRTRMQTYYERKPRIRAEALRIHGTRCFACGFDFSEIYGQHGEGYIEIHHLRPVSSYVGVTVVNPETDLIPLCSNCHRMVHRKEEALTPEELQCIIKEARNRQTENR